MWELSWCQLMFAVRVKREEEEEESSGTLCNDLLDHMCERKLLDCYTSLGNFLVRPIIIIWLYLEWKSPSYTWPVVLLSPVLVAYVMQWGYRSRRCQRSFNRSIVMRTLAWSSESCWAFFLVELCGSCGSHSLLSLPNEYASMMDLQIWKISLVPMADSIKKECLLLGNIYLCNYRLSCQFIWKILVRKKSKGNLNGWDDCINHSVITNGTSQTWARGTWTWNS